VPPASGLPPSRCLPVRTASIPCFRERATATTPVFEACRCRSQHENAAEHARRERGCVIIASIIALIGETARACAEKSREWRLERIRLVTIR